MLLQPRAALTLSLLAFLHGCPERPAGTSADPVMFRGGPAHTGVSDASLFGGQGGVRWSFQTGATVRATPAVTGDRVFAGSGDGRLYAIDRASGKPVWKYDAGSPVHASPAVAGGLVVSATLGGRIFAVDEATGTLRWSVMTGAPLPLNTGFAGGWDLYVSSPAVVGATVVIGGRDGGVYALDLQTGRRLWRAATHGRVRATPAVGHSTVIVGSFDGRIYGLDLMTGAERWVHRTVGDTLDSDRAGYDRRAVQSSAAIADGVVYVGSRDDGLYALDLHTGDRRWRFSHQTSWVVGSPAVSHGRVYVGSSDGHFIQAVNTASGQEIWRVATGANVLSSPLLVGGLLLVGTSGTHKDWGDLLALDPATGAIRWRLPFEGGIVSSPVAFENTLYLGTEAGAIVAIEEANPAIPHLAVFYDSLLAPLATVPGALLVRDYFGQLGYEALDGPGLGRFLNARIKDGTPSAVVFAIDVLPAEAAPVMADTVLLRRYLDAGGKIIWTGPPIGTYARNAAGRVVAFVPGNLERLAGVPVRTLDSNEYPASPTDTGRRWGVTRWFRGIFPLDTTAVSHALAVDEVGQTTAWVRTYRPDYPGSGYVQLWGFGATLERLPAIRAVAEYGLRRR